MDHSVLIAVGDVINDSQRKDLENFLYQELCGFSDTELTRLASLATSTKPDNQYGSCLTFNSSDAQYRVLIRPSAANLATSLTELIGTGGDCHRCTVLFGGLVAETGADWFLHDAPFTSPMLLATVRNLVTEKLTEKSEIQLTIVTPLVGGEWRDIPGKLDSASGRIKAVVRTPVSYAAGEKEEARSLASHLVHQQHKVTFHPDDQSHVPACIQQQLSNRLSAHILSEGGGDATLIAVEGFNLLINAGYRGSSALCNLLRQVPSVDTLLVTDWSAHHLLGISDLLGESGEATAPVSYCISPPTKQSLTCDEPAWSQLVVTRDQAAARLHKCSVMCDDLIQDGCARHLYSKLGCGSLDLYSLCPSEDDVRRGSSDLSGAALLVWRSAVQEQAPIRILVTGRAHESHIIRGLESVAARVGCITKQETAASTATAREQRSKPAPAAKSNARLSASKKPEELSSRPSVPRTSPPKTSPTGPESDKTPSKKPIPAEVSKGTKSGAARQGGTPVDSAKETASVAPKKDVVSKSTVRSKPVTATVGQQEKKPRGKIEKSSAHKRPEKCVVNAEVHKGAASAQPTTGDNDKIENGHAEESAQPQVLANEMEKNDNRIESTVVDAVEEDYVARAAEHPVEAEYHGGVSAEQEHHHQQEETETNGMSAGVDLSQPLTAEQMTEFGIYDDAEQDPGEHGVDDGFQCLPSGQIEDRKGPYIEPEEEGTVMPVSGGELLAFNQHVTESESSKHISERTSAEHAQSEMLHDYTDLPVSEDNLHSSELVPAEITEPCEFGHNRLENESVEETSACDETDSLDVTTDKHVTLEQEEEMKEFEHPNTLEVSADTHVLPEHHDKNDNTFIEVTLSEKANASRIGTDKHSICEEVDEVNKDTEERTLGEKGGATETGTHKYITSKITNQDTEEDVLEVGTEEHILCEEIDELKKDMEEGCISKEVDIPEVVTDKHIHPEETDEVNKETEVRSISEDTGTDRHITFKETDEVNQETEEETASEVADALEFGTEKYITSEETDEMNKETEERSISEEADVPEVGTDTHILSFETGEVIRDTAEADGAEVGTDKHISAEETNEANKETEERTISKEAHALEVGTVKYILCEGIDELNKYIEERCVSEEVDGPEVNTDKHIPSEETDEVSKEVDKGSVSEEADLLKVGTEKHVLYEETDEVNRDIEEGSVSKEADALEAGTDNYNLSEETDEVSKETEERTFSKEAGVHIPFEETDEVNKESDEGSVSEEADALEAGTDNHNISEETDELTEETEERTFSKEADVLEVGTDKHIPSEETDEVNKETDKGSVSEDADLPEVGTEKHVLYEETDEVNKDIEEGFVKKEADALEAGTDNHNISEETDEVNNETEERTVSKEADVHIPFEETDEVNKETDEGSVNNEADALKVDTEKHIPYEEPDEVNKDIEEGFVNNDADPLEAGTDNYNLTEATDEVNNETEERTVSEESDALEFGTGKHIPCIENDELNQESGEGIVSDEVETVEADVDKQILSKEHGEIEEYTAEEKAYGSFNKSDYDDHKVLQSDFHIADDAVQVEEYNSVEAEARSKDGDGLEVKENFEHEYETNAKFGTEMIEGEPQTGCLVYKDDELEVSESGVMECMDDGDIEAREVDMHAVRASSEMTQSGQLTGDNDKTLDSSTCSPYDDSVKASQSEKDCSQVQPAVTFSYQKDSEMPESKYDENDAAEASQGRLESAEDEPIVAFNKPNDCYEQDVRELRKHSPYDETEETALGDFGEFAAMKQEDGDDAEVPVSKEDCTILCEQDVIEKEPADIDGRETSQITQEYVEMETYDDADKSEDSDLCYEKDGAAEETHSEQEGTGKEPADASSVQDDNNEHDMCDINHHFRRNDIAAETQSANEAEKDFSKHKGDIKFEVPANDVEEFDFTKKEFETEHTLLRCHEDDEHESAQMESEQPMSHGDHFLETCNFPQLENEKHSPPSGPTADDLGMPERDEQCCSKDESVSHSVFMQHEAEEADERSKDTDEHDHKLPVRNQEAPEFFNEEAYNEPVNILGSSSSYSTNENLEASDFTKEGEDDQYAQSLDSTGEVADRNPGCEHDVSDMLMHNIVHETADCEDKGFGSAVVGHDEKENNAFSLYKNSDDHRLSSGQNDQENSNKFPEHEVEEHKTGDSHDNASRHWDEHENTDSEAPLDLPHDSNVTLETRSDRSTEDDGRSQEDAEDDQDSHEDSENQVAPEMTASYYRKDDETIEFGTMETENYPTTSAQHAHHEDYPPSETTGHANGKVDNMESAELTEEEGNSLQIATGMHASYYRQDDSDGDDTALYPQPNKHTDLPAFESLSGSKAQHGEVTFQSGNYEAGEDHSAAAPSQFDPYQVWGQPLGLPSPTVPSGKPETTSTKPASARLKSPATEASKRPKSSSATSPANGGVPRQAREQQSGEKGTKSSASAASGKLSSGKNGADKSPADGPKPTERKAEPGTKTVSAEKKSEKGNTEQSATKAAVKKTADLTSASRQTADKKTDPLKSGQSKPGTAVSTTGPSSKSPATSKTTPSRGVAPATPYYVDMAFIPDHGNPSLVGPDFFTRVRARYYVLAAPLPDPPVLDALLMGREAWTGHDASLPVTLVLTCSSHALETWLADHQNRLSLAHIDITKPVSISQEEEVKAGRLVQF